MTLQRSAPPSFLSLPLELRFQIYHYLIPRRSVIDVSDPYLYPPWSSEEDSIALSHYWHLGPRRHALLSVSKQVSDECQAILYSENIFKLHLNGDGQYYLQKKITDKNRRRIRFLLLVAQPMGVSFNAGHVPDASLWASIFENLSVLRIVVKQPTDAAGYHDGPRLEQDIREWILWIHPFLECFGRHLRRGTIVEVDDNGLIETRSLVEEYLPSSYRKIQCHLGDLLFKRGDFSIESVFWDDDFHGPY
jgi:hypothetical protein